jgi:ABC-type transport system substrate-binding protein
MDRAVGRAEHLKLVGRQNGVVYIYANTTGVLRTAQTRKAVLGAIDTETIAQRVFRQHATDVLLPGLRIDPPVVKTLAGVPAIKVLYAKSPAIEEIALLMVDSLQRHGLETTLQGVPLVQYEPIMRAGDFDLAIDSTAYAVPEDLAAQWTCATVAPAGANFSRLCDPKLDGALNRGASLEIGTRLNDDAPLRPVVAYEQYAAVGPRLNMAPIAPLSPWFANLSDWTVTAS